MTAFDTAIQLIYVAAASAFVLGLHMMNTPATARRGNQVSVAGMVAALAATLALIIHTGAISATGWIVMIAGALVGGGAGLYSARTIQMTAMPQLVSVFNAVGGGAAALVGIHDYMRLAGAGQGVAGWITITTVLDVIIGAVTFSGSIVAAGKLLGVITSAPVSFPGAKAFLVAMVHDLPEQVCAILIRLVVIAAAIVTIARSGVVVGISFEIVPTIVPKCHLLLTFTL